MAESNSPVATLEQIKAVLLRHPGSFAAIARKLGVRDFSVSLCLSGRSASRRIEGTARALALQLLKQEEREAEAEATKAGAA